MAHVLLPMPRLDSDPTEVSVSWLVLRQRGHRISFATPDGKPGQCDPMMIHGCGLDPWGFLPGLDRIRLVGLILRANGVARQAHRQMLADAAFMSPTPWSALRATDYDALLLPGGHRARGMREYLESETLQPIARQPERLFGCSGHRCKLSPPHLGHGTRYDRRRRSGVCRS